MDQQPLEDDDDYSMLSLEDNCSLSSNNDDGEEKNNQRDEHEKTKVNGENFLEQNLNSSKSSSTMRMNSELIDEDNLDQDCPFFSDSDEMENDYREGKQTGEEVSCSTPISESKSLESECSDQDCPFFSDSDEKDEPIMPDAILSKADEPIMTDAILPKPDKPITAPPKPKYVEAKSPANKALYDDLFHTSRLSETKSVGVQVGNCDCARRKLLQKQTEDPLCADFTTPLCCVDGCDRRRVSLIKMIRDLIRLARVESNRFKRELKDASLRLLTKPHVKCPNCRLEFRDSTDKRIMPSYVKKLRRSMTLELQFDSMDAMYEWAFIHGIDKDRNEIPTLIHAEQITEHMSLREVGSFLPDLAVEMTKEMFRRKAEEKANKSCVKDRPEFMKNPKGVLDLVRKRKEAMKRNDETPSTSESLTSNKKRKMLTPGNTNETMEPIKKKRKYNDTTGCEDCDKELKASFLWKHFGCPVCDACRDVNGAHRLVPRRLAISKYGLKKAELDTRKPLLRFVTVSQDGERFYLTKQLEDRLLELRGNVDDLRGQIKQREKDKENFPLASTGP
ncbi:unnamed protein product, partial [Mesorhabditis belari]|uniref:Uncharacterized protein n=1 Tax=Mesorhabditis belari TaxID=2138241 RepID=A0AAF3EVC1_9BILA